MSLFPDCFRGVTFALLLLILPGCFRAARQQAVSDLELAQADLAALQAEGSDWAVKQAETLASKSPETVKVALRQVREGGQCATFEENMRMEYRIGWRKVQSPDFIEGVRAVIIDKDHAPKWSPDTLEAVTDAHVATFFETLGEDELSFE